MASTRTILLVLALIGIGGAIAIGVIYGIIETRKLNGIDKDTDRLLGLSLSLPDAVSGQCIQSVQTTLADGGTYIVNYSKPNGVACTDNCVVGTGACYSGECEGVCPGECNSIFGFDIACPVIYLSDQVFFAEGASDAFAFQNCEEGICRYYVLFTTDSGEFLDFFYPTFGDFNSHGSDWSENIAHHCMGMIADWDPSKGCLQPSFKSFCSDDGFNGGYCPNSPDTAVCIFEFNCARTFYDGFAIGVNPLSTKRGTAAGSGGSRTIPSLAASQAVAPGAKQLMNRAVAAWNASKIPAAGKTKPASFGSIPLLN
jgi:hypothetical protein